MQVSSVRQSSLVSAVVQRLRDFIEERGLTAGDRLPSEGELLGQLQVSRSVLREAVGRLETIGLIMVRRGQGMFVADPDSLSSCVNLVRSAMTISPRDLIQFSEFRTALECWAVRRAAELSRPEDVAELELLCEQMDRSDQSYAETIRYDFAFHRKIFEMTGNELMATIVSVLQQFIMAIMLQTTPRPRDRQRSRRLHLAIVNAIQLKDPQAAEKAMQNHMRWHRKRLTERHEGQSD
jgi:GntR family transcriptional repressor for pyruvate dehydrogenase complex